MICKFTHKYLSKLSDEYLPKIVSIRMTWNDQQIFDNLLIGSFCQKVLGIYGVRDHCGGSRGAAHSKCNLEHKVNKFIPVRVRKHSRLMI